MTSFPGTVPVDTEPIRLNEFYLTAVPNPETPGVDRYDLRIYIFPSSRNLVSTAYGVFEGDRVVLFRERKPMRIQKAGIDRLDEINSADLDTANRKLHNSLVDLVQQNEALRSHKLNDKTRFGHR